MKQGRTGKPTGCTAISSIIRCCESEKTIKLVLCYKIKVFVNIVKYKLDHMRKKMETEERDATSRSSFRF